jgi:multiple sugar transport system substrate-binding protein
MSGHHSSNPHQRKEVFRLFALHEAGRLNRRQLVRGLGQVGLTGAAAAFLLKHLPLAVRQALAQGATVEERALKAAAELAKNAPKKTVSILNPSGSAGNMKPFAQEWKDATGLDIELIEAPLTEMHQKGMQEAVAKSGQYDLMLALPV